MGSLTYVSFSNLINEAASSFFKPRRGLRQGCPLAPLLFLIVVECLGKALLDLKNRRVFDGLSFGNGVTLTHVLFVDDIILVCDGSEQSLLSPREVLNCFCNASGMVVNEDKSTIPHAGLEYFEISFLQDVFTFPLSKIETGLKYLGFHLKPCRYLIKDWDWLIAKVEKRVTNWSYRWLSKGGKLILIKSFLEAISVYWKQF